MVELVVYVNRNRDRGAARLAQDLGSDINAAREILDAALLEFDDDANADVVLLTLASSVQRHIDQLAGFIARRRKQIDYREARNAVAELSTAVGCISLVGTRGAPTALLGQPAACDPCGDFGESAPLVMVGPAPEYSSTWPNGDARKELQ